MEVNWTRKLHQM